MYAVPVLADHLVYSPLRGTTALVNDAAVDELRRAIRGRAASPAVADLLAMLRHPEEPSVPAGPVRHPMFLGLVPTRGCTMACRYCGFLDAPRTPPMPLDLASAAIDAYLDLVEDAGSSSAEVHFFGGEPLFAPEVVEFATAYARTATDARGMRLHVEITTNGLVPAARARWLGDWMDAVVLSLDGPAEVQDRHRPTAAGTGTFDAVLHTAEILSESSAELVVRSCVTETSVPTLVTWAERIASELRPSVVCLERMTPSARSDAAGLRPPDPWCFARSFLDASRVLRQHGILAVTSTTDLRECRPSCCPVGRDALIVMPDGTVNACYLLEQRWRAAGLDLRLGSVGADDRALHLDPVAVDRVRTLAATPAARCTRCLCRLHCAGGCHVDHRPGADDDGYDDLCVSTRVLTIAQLLERLGRDDLAASWLADDGALATSARWPSDLIGASS